MLTTKCTTPNLFPFVVSTTEDEYGVLEDCVIRLDKLVNY